jgi:hypothetical protein
VARAGSCPRAKLRHLQWACLFVTALTLTMTGSASATSSSSLDGFHTKAWAAQCVVPEWFESARPYKTLVCWTPNDGFTVEMTRFGSPTKSYLSAHAGYNDRFFAKTLLHYGQTWRFDLFGYEPIAFTCTSRSTGLTCTNRAGHGWWLGRYVGYRLF